MTSINYVFQHMNTCIIECIAHFGGRVRSPGHTAQHSPVGTAALGSPHEAKSKPRIING